MADWFVNWFSRDPDATRQAMLVAGIPLLQVIWILIGAIAVVVLAFAVLNIIHGLLESESHVEFHQFGDAKPRLHPPGRHHFRASRS